MLSTCKQVRREKNLISETIASTEHEDANKKTLED